jgi:hypothetical protein
MSLSIRLSTNSDDGVAIAAVALTSGRVVAGRSYRVGEAVHLLRLRRYRLLRQGGHVARLSSLRPGAAIAA